MNMAHSDTGRTATGFERYTNASLLDALDLAILNRNEAYQTIRIQSSTFDGQEVFNVAYDRVKFIKEEIRRRMRDPNV